MDESSTPASPAGPSNPSPKDVVGALGEAESQGKLKPLSDLMAEQGWTEDPGSVLLLAQKDDRTQGKTPEELAAAFREDPSLYDDIVAYGPGGKLESLGKSEDTEESDDEAPPATDDLTMASDPEMDKKKAGKVMKDMGKKPKDLETDGNAKINFMKQMATE